jgi:hypothetical protein
MSFLGRVLPFVLLAVAAGCTAQPADEAASASESNLDQADTPPADGPLTPDATFGTNGAITLTGPSAAISAAKRADGSIGVLGNKGSAASLTIIKGDGSAQVDVALDASHAISGRVLTHRDGLVVVGSNGRYFVTRVGADGAIDHAFTADPLDLVASDAAVTKGGKIVVAGSFGEHAAIVRLDANGTLDSTFGEQGVWLASDDRAAAAKIALGADDSIYALTTGADKNQLAHLSASGKADSKFAVATLPAGAPGSLVMADTGLRYIGPGSDSKTHAFEIDPAGAVSEGEAFAGTIIGIGTNGLVSAVTEGAACTVHVTERATASLSADECASVSYVALGGGKRALISNTASGVSVRVFAN